MKGANRTKFDWNVSKVVSLGWLAVARWEIARFDARGTPVSRLARPAGGDLGG